MTTTINADTSVGGAIVTGDTSGQLGLQADGTTLLTVAGDITVVLPLALKLMSPNCVPELLSVSCPPFSAQNAVRW